MTDYYNIIISPETIKGDLKDFNYNGTEVGYYVPMSTLLSSGPNGTSPLTGLTIPILLKQSALDAGYYTPFDGAVLQKDVVVNFIFSSTTSSPYRYYLYNTSSEFQKFLELSSYSVNWGDGTVQSLTSYTPNFIFHDYPVANKEYKITLTQINPWGTTVVEKNVTTPFTNIIPSNPNGTAFFVSNNGSWSATPISYNYIFSGDAVNVVSAQTSNNYVSVPFTISGLTKSRITELKLYGTPPYKIGVPVISNGQIWGAVNSIGVNATGYTIQGVDFFDFKDGTTIYFQQSSGLTEFNLTAEPITKDEALLKVMDQPQIQTDVFVERGKLSAYERIQRLGEVDNLGDMINYGYGFFNVENKD